MILQKATKAAKVIRRAQKNFVNFVIFCLKYLAPRRQGNKLMIFTEGNKGSEG
jgi:hypothetical protein